MICTCGLHLFNIMTSFSIHFHQTLESTVSSNKLVAYSVYDFQMSLNTEI